MRDLNRAVANFTERRTSEMVKPDVFRQILIELLRKDGTPRDRMPPTTKPLGRAMFQMLRREMLREPLSGYLRRRYPHLAKSLPSTPEKLLEQLAATAEELRA